MLTNKDAISVPKSSVESWGGRYILPQIEERTPQGVRLKDPYSKMFEDRIVFLAAPVDATSSSDIVAQLLALDAMDNDRNITLYINSPGGSLIDASTIIDAIGLVKSPVATVCIGQASSVAALVLAAGDKGRRAALPNSHVMLFQPESGGNHGQASDITLEASRIKGMRVWMENFLSKSTNTPLEKIHSDIERKLFLTPEEALDYGIIDKIFS